MALFRNLRMLCCAAALCTCMMLCLCTGSPAAVSADSPVLTHETGYLLEQTGAEIPLDHITFTYHGTAVSGRDCTVRSDAPDAEITEAAISFTKDGAHKVDFTYQSSSCTLYMITRSGEDGAYILYEEDFDSLEDGTLPEGWTVASAVGEKNAYVKNHAFYVDASQAELGKIMLPSYLGMFGNYQIEMEVTFLSVRDAARWFSIVYRQQADEQYYQMCVRQAATAANGVELAIRTPGAWNVIDKAGASADLSINEPGKLKLSVYGTQVQEFVQDELVLNSSALSGQTAVHQTGAVGFQVNFSKVLVDQIKVTLLNTALTPAEKPADAKDYVSVPDSIGVFITPPSIVTEITSNYAELVSGAFPPATVILYLNESLEVLDAAGTVIGPLQTVLHTIDMQSMVALYVRNEAAAVALLAFLEAHPIHDAFIMSQDPALVAKVRAAQKMLRGIVDYGSVGASQADLDHIVYTTNANAAKIAVIDEAAATKANVTYLQNRLITVWVRSSAETKNRLYNPVFSGANGIVTSAVSQLSALINGYYEDQRILVRTPFVIAHRGLPSQAPENSLEAARLAYEAGADCIELDIRFTKDKEIVVFHDDALDGLTDGSGAVSSKTYAELQQINLLRSGGYGTFQKYPKVRIPTFREFLEEFKKKDVILFVEIKSTDAGLAEAAAELIASYEMENQVCVITFHRNQATAFAKAMPGVSVGFLTGTPSGGTGEVTKNILSQVVPFNNTFHASGMGSLYVINAMHHRGITNWPWTYGAGNTNSAYLLGVGGITTDYADLTAQLPVDIRLDEMTYRINLNGNTKRTLTPEITTRTGKLKLTQGNQPQLILLEGSEAVSVSGNTITAKADGTALLMYRYVHNGASPNENYSLYSQLITVEVYSGEKEPEGTSGNARFPFWIAAIAVAAAAAAVVTLLIVLRRQKRKKDTAG